MNANERLQRGRGDPFEPRAEAASSDGSRATKSRRSATRPGTTRSPATDRQDQPIANVAPTNAGPAAIPRLPPIPCQPIPRPCSATTREMMDNPVGWYIPEKSPSAPRESARNGTDGLAATATMEVAIPAAQRSSRQPGGRRSARNPNGTAPRP